MNLYPLIADRVQHDPSVLGQALQTADRWLDCRIGSIPRLKQWQLILRRAKECPEGLAELLRLLRDESEEARRLKDFGPFAGILSREERRKAFLKCAYDH